MGDSLLLSLNQTNVRVSSCEIFDFDRHRREMNLSFLSKSIRQASFSLNSLTLQMYKLRGLIELCPRSVLKRSLIKGSSLKSIESIIIGFQLMYCA